MDNKDQDVLGRRINGTGSEPAHPRLAGAGDDVDTLALANFINQQRDDLSTVRKERAGVDPMDALKSPVGLIGGLGALAAAVFGKPDIAANLLGGMRTGAMEGAERKTDALDTVADDVRADVAEGRSALSMLFQSRPDAFMDADGRDIIEPRILGRALTGMPIPISAAAIHAQARRTNAEKSIMQSAVQGIFSADTDEARERWARIYSAQGDYGWDEDQIKALSRVKDDGSFWALMYPNADFASVLNTHVYFLLNGLRPQDDPDALLRIAPRVDLGTWTPAAELHNIGLKINAWMNQDYPGRKNLTLDEKAVGALQDSPAELAMWLEKYQGLDDVDALELKDYMAHMAVVVQQISVIRLWAKEKADDLFGEPNSEKEKQSIMQGTQSQYDAARRMRDESATKKWIEASGPVEQQAADSAYAAVKKAMQKRAGPDATLLYADIARETAGATVSALGPERRLAYNYLRDQAIGLANAGAPAAKIKDVTEQMALLLYEQAEEMRGAGNAGN